MFKIKYLLNILALTAVLLAPQAQAAAGDDYPTRPVRLLVPNPPGGGSDAVARILAQKLGERMNQQDFAPVALVAAGQYMLVLHPSVPAKNLKDFVTYAKANPGKINYASAGNGSPLHLAAELFKARAGVNMVHVPYKGGGPATAAILGGEVQAVFGSITSVVPQVKSGKLTPIGVTGASRSQLAPEYPTIAELGYPGFEMTSWYGVLLPAKSPPAVTTKLNVAINEALRAKDVIDNLKRQGLDATGGTSEAFAAHIKSELVKWAKVVKDANIKVD